MWEKLLSVNLPVVSQEMLSVAICTGCVRLHVMTSKNKVYSKNLFRYLLNGSGSGFRVKLVKQCKPMSQNIMSTHRWSEWRWLSHNNDTYEGLGYNRQEVNSRVLQSICWMQEKCAHFDKGQDIMARCFALRLYEWLLVNMYNNYL